MLYALMFIFPLSDRECRSVRGASRGTEFKLKGSHLYGFRMLFLNCSHAWSSLSPCFFLLRSYSRRPMPIAVEINAGTNTGSNAVPVVLSRELVFLGSVVSLICPHVQDGVVYIFAIPKNACLYTQASNIFYTNLAYTIDDLCCPNKMKTRIFGAAATCQPSMFTRAPELFQPAVGMFGHLFRGNLFVFNVSLVPRRSVFVLVHFRADLMLLYTSSRLGRLCRKQPQCQLCNDGAP